MHAEREERREPATHAAWWPFAPPDASAALPLAADFQVNLERILMTTRTYFRIGIRAGAPGEPVPHMDSHPNGRR